MSWYSLFVKMFSSLDFIIRQGRSLIRKLGIFLLFLYGTMNKTDSLKHGNGRFNKILKAFFENRKDTEILAKEFEISVPQFQVIKNGIKCTYVAPICFKDYMDYLALKLKGMDLKVLRTVLICQVPVEGKQLRVELDNRDIRNTLVVFDDPTMEAVMPLWPEGFLRKLLIISIDLLPQMPTEKIDLLILNEIPAEDFIHRVNPNCEFLCLISRQLSQQEEIRNIVVAPANNSQHFERYAAKLPSDPKVDSQLKIKAKQVAEKKDWRLKDVLQMGRYYTNFGIIAWSTTPLVSCVSIMGVSGISSAIRLSMQKLEFSHERAHNVQRYAWPHLACGHSMIMIGHEKCGKSWSYIPIISERIYKSTIKEGNVDWNGPLCILVAANSHQGQELTKVLSQVLAFCSSDKMEIFVTLWDKNNISKVVTKLMQPCGIFITTADLMLQLHQMESKRHTIFYPETVRCLVLDNLGYMCHNYPLRAPKMLKWLKSQFVFNKHGTQLIITGKLWMEKLMRRQLIPLMSDILLIFEDGLEASVNGGIKLSIKFVSDNDHDKSLSLLKVLSGRDLENERIVIVCYREIDCLKVRDKLIANNVPHLCYDVDGREMCEQVKFKKGVFIAIDSILPRLKFGPVDLLINYTLTHTWHRFKFRFNLFHANYMTAETKRGEALIFLTPLETEQVWLFSDFLLKHDMDMPQDWLDYLNNFRIQNEKLLPRLNVKLCQQLLAYGNCYRRTCRYRHEMRLDEIKPANHLPLQGKIHFRILYWIDPINMSINLVENSNSIKVYKHSLDALNDRIQTFYENVANQIKLVNPSIGDICIIKFNNRFQRFIITNIDDLPIVEVRQLDWATEQLSKLIEELLICAECFRYDKYEAINLRVTGIMPYSMDRLWNDNVKRFIRHKFFNYPYRPTTDKSAYRDLVYTATIDFAFHDTIFVDNVFNHKGRDLRKVVMDNLKVFDDKLVKRRFSRITGIHYDSTDIGTSK